MNWRVRKAFSTQKRHAEERGIRWCFEFEQWKAWWYDELGPDWFEKRGRHRGQYVMARNGDKGPYAVWHVKCTLVEDNHAQRAENKRNPLGSWHGNSKINEDQAREIYLAKGSERSIGQKYGLSGGSVGEIKRGETWGHATAGLGPAHKQPQKQRGKKFLGHTHYAPD